ncbi:hypothetical protein RJ639_028914 [Escallonia herrerae]|uniref:Uncharacterized protein n=1 Tax=Escallonia herrerae TaxID=1293975 RepID=A0AA89BKQ9_9ASTE|nr:hypothetical protein RJ639_028914 [Escallonia herrerae]
MATTSSSLPEEQPLLDQPVTSPGGVSSAAWHSSGSIGPFFAVKSVLTVLAIISCVIGRICRSRTASPLESVKDRGCCGWVKLKFGRCMAAGDAELGDQK